MKVGQFLAIMALNLLYLLVMVIIDYYYLVIHSNIETDFIVLILLNFDSHFNLTFNLEQGLLKHLLEIHLAFYTLECFFRFIISNLEETNFNHC